MVGYTRKCKQKTRLPRRVRLSRPASPLLWPLTPTTIFCGHHHHSQNCNLNAAEGRLPSLPYISGPLSARQVNGDPSHPSHVSFRPERFLFQITAVTLPWRPCRKRKLDVPCCKLVQNGRHVRRGLLNFFSTWVMNSQVAMVFSDKCLRSRSAYRLVGREKAEATTQRINGSASVWTELVKNVWAIVSCGRLFFPSHESSKDHLWPEWCNDGCALVRFIEDLDGQPGGLIRVL